MTKSKKLVFFGTEEFSLPALELLVSSGYEVAMVVTKPDYKKGRGRKIEQPAVKNLAQKLGIPVFQPENLGGSSQKLRSLGAIAGVLVSYGKILPKNIINIFPKGILNIHPSLLPKYRGPSPIETVILKGDDNTAVSIMSLVERMDAGPIYAQEIVELTHTETRPKLYKKLSQLGAELLVKTLPGVLNGTLEAKPQNDGKASFTHMISKAEGVLDWGKPGEQLEREIRAYLGWPQSRTELFGRELIITKAYFVATQETNKTTVTDVQEMKDAGLIQVECSNGYLCIERLKPSGKQEISAKEFLNGLRT